METKVCTKCKVEKPFTRFYKHSKSKFGLEGACMDCRNAQRKEWEKATEGEDLKKKIRNKKWREANVEYCKQLHKEWKLKNYNYILKYFKEYNKNRTSEQKLLSRGNIIKKYWPGTTSKQALEKYEELLKNQNYSCAICKQHKSHFKKSLAIDHSHKNGKVRGALCYRCNRLYVSIHTKETARAVLEYLEKNDG